MDDEKVVAEIISVQTSGNKGNYNFSVGIKSQDTGCGQYADWWEVLSESGTLIYRRTLAHSHVNEQPFVRSGGPVKIEIDEIVIIRAHMNTSGYGGKVFKGSVQDSFFEETLSADFAAGVENELPQPGNCAY